MGWILQAAGRVSALAAACLFVAASAAPADDAPPPAAATSDSYEGALKPYAAGPDAPAFPVDYYDGLRAFDNGRPELAIVLWLQASDLGDTRAMVRIAEAFAGGTALPPSPVGAAYYYGITFKRGALDEVEHARAARDALTAAQQADLDKAIAAYVPARATSAPARAPEDAFVDAVTSGDTDAAKKLLADRPSLATEPDRHGWQPVMLAALSGNVDTIKLLLDAGAGPDDASDDGYTPLHVAAFAGSRTAANALIAGGAHAAITTPAGVSAADIARASKHDDLAQYLADVQQSDVAAMQEKLNTLGYDVGTPDGTLSETTRDQLAIFANRLLLDPVRTPTADLVTELFAETATDLWGYVVQYTKGGDKWSSYDFDYEGDDRQSVTDEALQKCKDDGGKGCKVSIVVPEGSCMSHVNKTALWSRVFADEDSAAADAKNRCRAQGMSTCELSTVCVGD